MFKFKVNDEYFCDELLEFVGSKQGYLGIKYISKTKDQTASKEISMSNAIVDIARSSIAPSCWMLR